MANMASACALVLASGGDSQKNIFGSTRSWKTKEAATTCALVTISTVSICVMVVSGVWLGREHALSSSYEPTRCSVVNVTFMPYDSCSYCPVYKEKFSRQIPPSSSSSSSSSLSHHNQQHQLQQHHKQLHQKQQDIGAETSFDRSSDVSENSHHGVLSTTSSSSSVSLIPPSSSLLSHHCSQTFFPCLQITVTFQVNSRRYDAILHKDSVQASGPHSKCSYQICESEKNIKKYAERWIDMAKRYNGAIAKKQLQGSILQTASASADVSISTQSTKSINLKRPVTSNQSLAANGKRLVNWTVVSEEGDDDDDITNENDTGNRNAALIKPSPSLSQHTFECYYNTENFASVIEKKVYSKWDVTHSMLWPGLVVLVCVVLFLRHESKRRRLTFCGRREDDPPDDPDSRSVCRGHPLQFRHDFYPVSTTLTLLEHARGAAYGSVICDLGRPPKRFSEQLSAAVASKRIEQHRRSLQHSRQPLYCSPQCAASQQHHRSSWNRSSWKSCTDAGHHYPRLLSILQPGKAEASQDDVKVDISSNGRRAGLSQQDSELSTTPSQSVDQSVAEAQGDQTRLMDGDDHPVMSPERQSRENDSNLSSTENIGGYLRHKRRSSTGNLLLLPNFSKGGRTEISDKIREPKFQSFQALTMWL